MAAPSFDDLVALGTAAALSKRPDLTVNDGDITEAMIHAGAAMAEAAIREGALNFRDTFIDGAKGAKLAQLVSDHLNIEKFDANEAEVTVAFSRTSSGAAGSIPINTEVGTAFLEDGQQVVFKTTVAVAVGAGLNGPFNVVARCARAGRVGNVKAGTITKVISSLFDSFTVTNAAVAAGGADEESDEDLRARARTFWTTLRRGTLAAIEYGALRVPGVASATVTEDQTTGIVYVQIADADGNATIMMKSDVEAELENWSCAGVHVEVALGSARIVDIDFTLVVKDGFDTASASPTIIAAVENRINKLRAGESLYLDSLIAAIIGVAPDDILDVTFTNIDLDTVGQPIADIVAAIGDVIRPGTITVS